MCQCLDYSGGNFQFFFRPAGVTCCTNGGEIWHEGVDHGSTPACHILPHQCRGSGSGGVGPENCKFYTKFQGL